LLQQGAHIAISAIDILEQIDIQSPKPSSDYLKELFPYPCSIFELSQRLQMNLSDVIDLVEKLHNQRLVETDGLLWYPQKR
jgi:predicted Rossmann fold nucleotide-binding protein DprA/Smf involved in DNA uptake